MTSVTQPILNVGLPDNLKPIVDASHPQLGDIGLHANQLLSGFGKNKRQITAIFQPQSGVQGAVENSTFDIIMPATSGNSSINIIDQLILQMSVIITNPSAAADLTLKPIQQWFNRVEISQDGGNQLQIIYFDQQFAQTVMNSNISNLDDIKSELNLDPRNFLPWFDEFSQGIYLEMNSDGTVLNNQGKLGRSTYLSQPYFQSFEADETPTQDGFLRGYIANAKGGYLTKANYGGKYTFYLPLNATILQSAKILMNQLNSNIRFRFYMNSEVKLYDAGAANNSATVSFDQVNLWVYGSQLSDASLALLDAKYLNPVVSSFNYYLEMTQEFSPMAVGGTFNEIVLSPLTGLCTSLLFWIEDTRSNILYPEESANGIKYKNGNMMTLPIQSYSFISDQGAVFGSGTPIPNNLAKMINSYRRFPKSVSQDDRLYFRQFYTLDFSNDPITAENESVFGGSYLLTGRERLRIYCPDPAESTIPATVFPKKELNKEGNAVDENPASTFYTNTRVHIVASIMGECVQAGGLLTVNLPRNY